MSINVDYTPFGAVAELGQIGGLGRYRQQQLENAQRQQQLDQSFLLSQQQMAQQQANAAAAYQSREQDRALDFVQRQQAMWQQNAYQQAAVGQRTYDTQQDFLNRRLQENALLEKQGFGYSPTQQKQLDDLQADLDHGMADEGMGDYQRQQLQDQYWQKKSAIRPTAPPPKTKQQILDESIARYTFPDGTEVVGTMGERNGVPTFDPIENPNVKQQQVEQKAAFDREKHISNMELQQHKLDAQQAQIELRMRDADEKMRQQQQLHQQTMQFNAVKQVRDGYERMRKAQEKARDDAAKAAAKAAETGQSAPAGDLDRRINMLEEAFRDSYGSDAQKYVPEIAAEVGLQAPSPGGLDEGAFFQQQPQSSAQQQGPPPTITSPEVAANLPSGFRFIGPDGKVHKVP